MLVHVWPCMNDCIYLRWFGMLIITHAHLHFHQDGWPDSYLESTYWHICTSECLWKFLAAQVKEVILQLTVLPIGLIIMLRVFMKMVRVVASILPQWGISILMYLDDWLMQVLTVGLHSCLRSWASVSPNCHWLHPRWWCCWAWSEAWPRLFWDLLLKYRLKVIAKIFSGINVVDIRLLSLGESDGFPRICCSCSILWSDSGQSSVFRGQLLVSFKNWDGIHPFPGHLTLWFRQWLQPAWYQQKFPGWTTYLQCL